jgi:hypothetical protein
MKPIIFDVDGAEYRVNYLLTQVSAKTSKGEKLGYLTGVLYMNNRVLPKVFCPSHTGDCMASCLRSSGNLGLIDGHNALTARALLFVHHRDAFILRLKAEIAAMVKKAERAGLTPCIRLNGSSDIPWELEKNGAVIGWIMDNFPQVHVYDYTKIPGRAARFTENGSNYRITFSWSGENKKQCEKMLKLGCNVAVPFDIKRGSELPATFLNYRVIDGDKHDLRFLDDKGVVVGLRYKHSFDGPNKGRKQVKRMGFIVEANDVR